MDNFNNKIYIKRMQGNKHCYILINKLNNVEDKITNIGVTLGNEPSVFIDLHNLLIKRKK